MSFFRQKVEVEDSSVYLIQIETILRRKISNGDIDLDYHWDTPAEAREHLAHIASAQRSLRQIKKDVSQEIKRVRSTYSARRGAVSPSFFARVAGAKRIAHSKATRREKMRQQEETVIAGFQGICKLVDQAMRQLDRFEGEIGAWLADNP